MGAVKGEKGQRPWQKIPEVMQRVVKVHELTMQRLPAFEIASQLDVSERTVEDDRKRYRQYAREHLVADVDNHVERLGHLSRKAWEMLNETDSRSLNKSAILAQLRQIEMDIAKLDGSLKEKLEVDTDQPITFTLNIQRPED